MSVYKLPQRDKPMNDSVDDTLINTFPTVLNTSGKFNNQSLDLYYGGGAMGWSDGTANGKLGVRIPAATDLSGKNR